ncbi:MAG: 16S rRNA (cytosine(1402)-N(4))-methyltransferase RsmH [Patescibacteria group bacterium]|nr:16S rRNA (cytosine(1402)-N(4))-methyltransferase RsmH [Patescibacteria group bacterium]
MSEYHISVLLQETIDGLKVENGKKYIDATLGGGGHTREIINRGGIVLGIDQDNDALDYVKENFAEEIANSKLRIAKGNFSNIDSIAHEQGFENVQGILFDIGISSHHVDTHERGFSFLRNAPLDMRMDQSAAVSAADLVNGLTRGELQELFEKYAEETHAKKIAEVISRAREERRIETTGELAAIVKRGYPPGFYKIHPATKVFQALRIAVNDELNSIKDALPKAFELLGAGGRIAVISFHSLEDRIVKQTFVQLEAEGVGTILTAHPVQPTEKEMEENRRSRSAKLRIIEKL